MRHFRSCIAAVLVAATAPCASAQEQRPYRPGIDVLDYAITLDIPDSGAVIQGDVMLTLRRLARIDTLVLDLKLLKVSRVTVDDKPVKFDRTDSTILIPLPRGDTSTWRVRVTYAGAVSDGLIARKDTAGRWTYFGDNWPNRARYWIPSVDHPSDKATVTWSVRTTKKRGRTVIANGQALESFGSSRGPNAVTTYRWREAKPIPPYLMVIAVAPLISKDFGDTACGLAENKKCVRQQVYVAPEQWGVLPGAFEKAPEIVKYFASTVGPFPYEKLSHLQSSTRFGGMENASAIFYNDRDFRRGGVRESVIAHEIAHQWFGDAVTERDWPHLWLSEGFATYFAALWAQSSRGDTAFRTEMGRIRETILADTGAVLRRPVIDTIETTLMRLLNRNSYEKGGFVLHMLRAQVGDSAFFKGIRDYYNKYKHATALTGDLQAALEKSSGRKLGAFFDQWLRRPGYPEIEVTWRADSASQTLELGVGQAARFGAFEFPLRLLVTDQSGQQRRLDVSIPAQPDTRIMLPVSGVITSVIVDPDVQLLARIESRNAEVVILSSAKDLFLEAAIAEARAGLAEGGIPIGSVLVIDGKIVGRGHNRRVQKGSAILHAEMDCLENAGRLSAKDYQRATLYSTLSPCDMCSGTALLYGIPRVVIGENRTFKGPEDYVRSRGVTLEVRDDAECVKLMRDFIAARPDLWNEDIGK